MRLAVTKPCSPTEGHAVVTESRGPPKARPPDLWHKRCPRKGPTIAWAMVVCLRPCLCMAGPWDSPHRNLLSRWKVWKIWTNKGKLE